MSHPAIKSKSRAATSIVVATCAIALFCGSGTGWCGHARGVFSLGTPGGSVPDAVLANPNVDGIALLYLWGQIEPSEGQFRWDSIDAQVARVKENGKVYSLGVTPGVNTPQWVYHAGAEFFEFRWDKPWGPKPCTMVRFPVPWDKVYLKKWQAFVRELGARYAHDPQLVLLKIQGVNAQTPEFLLPHDRPGAGARLVSCAPGDEVAEWQRMGYRPSKVVGAWKVSAKAFGKAFANQDLAIETGPWGMPPISDSGKVTLARGADVDLPIAIVSVGKEELDGRFVAQNDGLNAIWAWPQLPSLAAPESIAFQMAWKATGDPTCRMNGFQRPCDPRQMLQAAIDRGIEAGAEYLEIYQADLLNPGLDSIIGDAHQRFLALPADNR